MFEMLENKYPIFLPLLTCFFLAITYNQFARKREMDFSVDLHFNISFSLPDENEK
jgi:hypothetical protein